MASEQQTPTGKSGVIGVIGRPSAGKSTLINRICGAKVSITSPYPQTTRTRIRGIFTEDRGQLMFLDTPGYHNSEKKLNIGYQNVVTESLPECDAIMYLRDSTRIAGSEEQAILDLISRSKLPWIAVCNKIDALGTSTGGRLEAGAQAVGSLDPGPIEAGDWSKWGLPEDHPPLAAVAISAETGAGMDDLLKILFELAPEGPQMYPEEYYTDQDPQFRIAEIIREQAIKRTEQEIPHAIYVEIADAEYNAEKETLSVRAFLIVERDSQKGIVVGKGGEKIKAIRMSALRQLKDLFSYRIKLDLRVKVQPKWRQREGTIRKITRSGYGG